MISDTSLAALLTGEQSSPDSALGLLLLAKALAELASHPAADELQGEYETLAAFRSQFGAPGRAHQPRHRPWLLSRALLLKAVTAAAAILSLGGLATAAYAGALPAGLQRLAHDVIGAPTPAAHPATGPLQASPGAAGHPGHGLCAAWVNAKAHGTRKQRAVAFGAVAVAAGGPDRVTAYCAKAAHPATPPIHRWRPAPTPHRSSKPTSLPTSHGSGEPTSLPIPHGSGKPTAHPTSHGSGKPTSLPIPHGSGKPTVHPTGGPARRPRGQVSHRRSMQ
jgi:hypothetical protein